MQLQKEPSLNYKYNRLFRSQGIHMQATSLANWAPYRHYNDGGVREGHKIDHFIIAIDRYVSYGNIWYTDP